MCGYNIHYLSVVFELVLQVKLSFTPEALAAIAEKALETKTGARGLRAILVSMSFMQMFFAVTQKGGVATAVINVGAIG